MPSEICSLVGMVLTPPRQLSAPARTLMPFRTPGNTMALWGGSEAWKRFGGCGRAALIRSIQSSCSFLLRKSRHALESDVSEAGCCLTLFLSMRLENYPTTTVPHWGRFSVERGSEATWNR